MPSNIPEARGLIGECLEFSLSQPLRSRLEAALAVMTRAPAVRKAKPKMPRLSEDMKREIVTLSANRHLSQSDIAVRVGLPASAGGRVSEVLNGLR